MSIQRIVLSTLILLLCSGLHTYAQTAAANPSAPQRQQTPLPDDFSNRSGVRIGKVEQMPMSGKNLPVRPLESINSGIVLKDGNGGIVWQNRPIPAPNPNNTAARELRLKVRELTDQLLGNLNPANYSGVTAMPISFVNQDDFEESSSFGRYLAETLFYEFNQRGFPVREYRSEGEIATRQGEGEFYFSRRQQRIYAQNPLSVFVTGTYYYDKHNVFVNARLIRASDGIVLRTGSLVFPQTDVSKRMLANTGRKLDATFVGMQDYDTMTSITDMSAIDLGQDLH